MAINTTLAVIFCGFLLYPLILIYIRINFAKLQRKAFRQRYLPLVENLHLERTGKKVLLQPAFFFARRLITVLFISFVPEPRTLSYVFSFSFIVQALLYGLMGNPFESRFTYGYEIFNDLIVLMVVNFLIAFKPGAVSLNEKDTLGIVACIIIGTYAVVNLAIVAGLALVACCRAFKACYRKRFQISKPVKTKVIKPIPEILPEKPPSSE